MATAQKSKMIRKYDYSNENKFNKRYSRFKLHAYLEKRAPLTHYGQERYGSTYPQLINGHIKKIILDRERGLQDCIDRLMMWDKLYTVTTALIYDRRRSTLDEHGEEILGKEIRKYKGTTCIECEDLQLTDLEKRVLCDVTIKEGILKIKPVCQPLQTNIDFKTEIANALSKKDNSQTTGTGQHH